jgi:GntR family transcriptional regulator
VDEFGDIRRGVGVAYYHQLYMLLVTALDDGRINAGSVLPSENDLMQRFQVSRNTVRRALAQLEREKRIVRRRGSGSYARSLPQAAVSPDTIVQLLQDADATRKQTANRLLRVQSSTTPEFIRRRDPNFGEKCMLVQHCRSFRREPFMISTSHVPERLAL